MAAVMNQAQQGAYMREWLESQRRLEEAHRELKEQSRRADMQRLADEATHAARHSQVSQLHQELLHLREGLKQSRSHHEASMDEMRRGMQQQHAAGHQALAAELKRMAEDSRVAHTRSAQLMHDAVSRGLSMDAQGYLEMMRAMHRDLARAKQQHDVSAASWLDQMQRKFADLNSPLPGHAQASQQLREMREAMAKMAQAQQEHAAVSG